MVFVVLIFLFNTNWNNSLLKWHILLLFRLTQFVYLMKPLNSSQFKSYNHLPSGSPSWFSMSRVIPVQVQCGFLGKTPGSYQCLEDNELRKTWGELQTQNISNRSIFDFLKMGNFLWLFMRSSWKFFVSVEGTQPSLLIFAVLRDHYHVYTSRRC